MPASPAASRLEKPRASESLSAAPIPVCNTRARSARGRGRERGRFHELARVAVKTLRCTNPHNALSGRRRRVTRTSNGKEMQGVVIHMRTSSSRSRDAGALRPRMHSIIKKTLCYICVGSARTRRHTNGEKRAQAQNGLRNAWRRQGKPYTLSCESTYAVPSAKENRGVGLQRSKRCPCP